MANLKRLISYFQNQTPYQEIEYGYGQLTLRIDENEYIASDIDNEHIRGVLTQLENTIEKLHIQEILIDTT